MFDTTQLWAQDSEGFYHRSICVEVNADDGGEPVATVPEDAVFAKCCADYEDEVIRES